MFFNSTLIMVFADQNCHALINFWDSYSLKNCLMEMDKKKRGVVKKALGRETKCLIHIGVGAQV